MREITHKGLARLVGLFGTHTMNSSNLEILVSSSVEPDEINREEVSKSMLEAISTSIVWMVDHTDRAKELAIQNIIKASKAYNSGDPLWSRWLGWAFHFITDWATPYHSSNARTKYIVDSKKDILDIKSKNGGISIGKIIANKILNAMMFKTDHDKFEEICEERWQQNIFIIKDNFIKSKENFLGFVNLEIFSLKMDELQATSEKRNLEWIQNCSDQEFSQYMVDIAAIMDIAYRSVLG